jgi:hypothetical protein
MKRFLPLGVLTLALFAAPFASLGQTWMTPCSSGGMIDESSTGLYQVFGSQLWHKAGATGDVVSRYDVINTSDTATPAWTTLELGYLDTGSNGSITATLWQVDPCTGAATSICSVTSANSASAKCVECTFASDTFNFGTNFYFVNVTVSRSTTTATARANTVRIF